MFVDLRSIVYSIHEQVHDRNNLAKKYFDIFSGDFYNTSEYKELPECVKNDIIKVPDDEWETAAEEFLRIYFNKKNLIRFKERFNINDSAMVNFWQEMTKLNLDREWRRFYAEFLFEKAEKWCWENNIHYTDDFHPHEEVFAL